jgi:hypothetical protein
MFAVETRPGPHDECSGSTRQLAGDGASRPRSGGAARGRDVQPTPGRSIFAGFHVQDELQRPGNRQRTAAGSGEHHPSRRVRSSPIALVAGLLPCNVVFWGLRPVPVWKSGRMRSRHSWGAEPRTQGVPGQEPGNERAGGVGAAGHGPVRSAAASIYRLVGKDYLSSPQR